MAIYQSRFTGQQIDEAVAKILYVAPKVNSIILYDDKDNIINLGTFEYDASTKTIQKIKLNVTTGSNDIVSVKIGTSENGNNLYDGTMPNGYIIDLGSKAITVGNSIGETIIYCTISDGQQNSSETAEIKYTYYNYSKLTISTTPDTSGAIKQTSSGADNTYSYTAGQYLWLYSRSSGKKIQTYVAGSWADVTTTPSSAITLTLASGATATYYAYRTDKFTATGQARYKLA